MNILLIVKRFWNDPVWSKIIASAILGLIGLLAFFKVQVYPPLTLETIKDLTYQIEGEYITLQKGKREFNPDLDQGIHEKAIYVDLVDHAFGDLDGDGSSDAIAVLTVSAGGGNAIMYYISTIYNDHGSPKVIGPAYALGDRLLLRSISIHDHKVTIQLMMHKPDDAMCCPTLFRTLEFIIQDKTLTCITEQCTEFN